MKIIKISLTVTLVVAAAVGWFLISPIFIDKYIDEAFVFTSTQSSMPTRKEFSAMSPDVQVQTTNQIMNDMAKNPDQIVSDEMMGEVTAQVLKQGIFKDADAAHRGSGQALLYQLPDGSHLLRLENFKVTNGPDLMVYLVKHINPTQASQVMEGFLNLGELKGNLGNQNYIIPAGTDINKFHSAVIWCELFGVLFSPSALSAK